jgi:transcriptional regulator of acetoin/glycerol metabolism
MPGKHLLDRLQIVRANYGLTPWIEPRSDESPLLRSWERSEASGLEPQDNVSFELVRRSMLAEIDDRHAGLIQQAKPETERLARALRHSDCSVLLVNESSVIIDRLIDESSSRKPLQAVSRKGVNLDEHCIGTTAPSIALRDGIPYLVGRDAHYAANNRGFFCVAAPIDDPLGRRVGALSIASYESVPGFDVLSLAVHAATGIENAYFSPTRDCPVVLHFHARPELVGTPMEGIIAIDGDNRIAGINRSALKLLCVTRDSLVGTSFGALMDSDLTRHLSGRDPGSLTELQTQSGLQLYARLSCYGAGRSSAHRWGQAPSIALSSAPAEPIAQVQSLRSVELELMRQALAEAKGNVTLAARRLGISRSSIYRRLSERQDEG